MSWIDWIKDLTGPGKVAEKVEKYDDGTKDRHFLRTADHTRTRSERNHSHVMVREKPDGSSSAHCFHGIEKQEETQTQEDED